jgi:tetratricopeptide (TPR) repeat protein
LANNWRNSIVARISWKKRAGKSEALPDALKAIVGYRLAITDETNEADTNLFLEKINTALQLMPDHGLSHAARAWVYFMRKELELAIDEITKAIESGPSEFLSVWYVERGIFRVNTQQLSESLADMTQACRLKSWSIDAHQHRFQLLKAMQDNISAMAESAFTQQLPIPAERQNLYQYYFSIPCYRQPEDLEITFMVLSDPLNPTARQFRAERLMELFVPHSALLDYQFVSWQTKTNLFAIARIEEIRENGIMSNRPIVEPMRPEISLLPEYAEVLKGYKNYYWRKTLWTKGFGLFPLWHKLMLRFGIGPLDENRKSAIASFFLALLASILLGILFGFLFDAEDYISFARIPQSYRTETSISELRKISGLLKLFLIISQMTMAYLASRSVWLIFKKDQSSVAETAKDSIKTILSFISIPMTFLMIMLINGASYRMLIQIIRWISG